MTGADIRVRRRARAVECDDAIVVSGIGGEVQIEIQPDIGADLGDLSKGTARRSLNPEAGLVGRVVLPRQQERRRRQQAPESDGQLRRRRNRRSAAAAAATAAAAARHRRIQRLDARNVICLQRELRSVAETGHRRRHRSARHRRVCESEQVSELVDGNVFDVDSAGAPRESEKLIGALVKDDVGIGQTTVSVPPAVGLGDVAAARRIAEEHFVPAVRGE